MYVNYTSKIQQSLNSFDVLIVSMKLTKLLPITILAMVLTVTLVVATHTSTITMSPNTWAKNIAKSVTISVTNNGADNIVKVELIVPVDSNQVPIYIVGDITRPEGWTYAVTGSPISKITWVATGSGIAGGSSLNLFGIDVKSPGNSGDYKWTWNTTDNKNGTYSGTITTTVGQAPVSYFMISGVPTPSVAGNSFKFVVKAYGDDNQIKTDYTGKISFTSTDVKAILPSDYSFQSTNYGVKEFSVAYKTSGVQSFTVKDLAAGISTDSIKTLVNPSSAVGIGINPENKAVSSGDKIAFTVLAKDDFDNVFEVTNKSTITIDKKAGGSWNGSTYTTGNEGAWIVIASYSSLVSGTTLTVGKATVVTPTEQENITTEIPSEEKPPEISLTIPESITIAPGANDTIVITVNNNGDKDLTGVKINVAGVPSDWTNVYPLTNDIPAKSSRDYLVVISIPQNESESKTIEFTAFSSEGPRTTKNTSLTISSAPTGFTTLPKNLLQLGVVIIAVAAVVIIGWELWFKKPKSK